MSADFGSSLFKVQGGVATTADLLSVLKSIVNDENMRQRCSGLSNLTSSLPEPKRREYCEAMVNLLFANFPPPEESQSDPSTVLLVYNATPEFLDRCCPPKYGKWTPHVVAKRDRMGKALSADISGYTGDRLAAIEQLWGMPGHLVSKR